MELASARNRASSNEPQRMQASLVAFYGPKTGPLRHFLRRCLDGVTGAIEKHAAGCSFRPYSLGQIHATVIGLERTTPASFENRNLHVLRGACRSMELIRFFCFLRESERLPLQAQFGGFANIDYPFASRGARPYDRTFSIQGEIAVVIGWPIGAAPGGFTAAQTYPRVVDDLRREAQRFNVLHRWHRRPTDVDNDLYVRLGLVDGELLPPERALIEAEIRGRLSASSPVIVRLGIADLTVVSYPSDDESLPEDRTRTVALADSRLQDESFIAGLYD
jgi:hypothetical protein